MAFRIKHNTLDQWYAGGAWTPDESKALPYQSRELAQQAIGFYNMKATVEDDNPPADPQPQEETSHPSQPEGQDDDAGDEDIATPESDDKDF